MDGPLLTQEQQEAMELLASRFGKTVAKKTAHVEKATKPAPVEPKAEPAQERIQKEREKVVAKTTAATIGEITAPVAPSGRSSNPDQETTMPIPSGKPVETKAEVQAQRPAPAKPRPQAPLATSQPVSSPAIEDQGNRDAERDEVWAMANLRCRNNEPYTDLANVLRIFDRHPEFRGRFKFDKSMGKVMDRGEVLLGWQIDELCAVVQERFLPQVPEDVVLRSLLICANRYGKS